MSGEEVSRVEKLTANNYHSWKFNMKMCLIGKDLWDLVQGNEEVGINANEEERRRSIICLSVSSNLQIYVRNSTTGKEAWNSLSGHFEENSLSKKIYYRRKLYSTRMDASTTMENHVNTIKTISEHLEALDDEVSEKDLVMILISSLPDEYHNLITAMETLTEDKLTWSYVRDRVLHEYDRKKSSSVSKVEKENSRALFTNPKWKKKVTDDDKKKNFKCHFCKEKGHFAFDCKKKKDAERRRKESASFCHETSIKPEFALQVDLWIFVFFIIH